MYSNLFLRNMNEKIIYSHSQDNLLLFDRYIHLCVLHLNVSIYTQMYVTEKMVIALWTICVNTLILPFLNFSLTLIVFHINNLRYKYFYPSRRTSLLLIIIIWIWVILEKHIWLSVTLETEARTMTAIKMSLLLFQL